MPVYVYKALDAAGKNIKGSIDADSSASAKKKLRDMGLFITQIAETVISTRSRTSPLTIFLFQREKTAFLASFNRQLATLLTAGLPLIRAFDAMIEQQDVPEVKDMTSAVRNAVKEGDTLARAMNKFPDYFPDLMINMIDAGENSGALEITLARLADYYEGKIKLRNQIRSTMAYPIFMSVVGLAVLIFLFIFLIPRVTAIFDQMETTLPLPTRFLIFVSSLVQTYWWCVILLLIVIGFVLFRITQ
ncbi:type II secretion system F family protein, partial [bacterium]|nr:type II secretion system F family protein [bacterium]